MLIRMLVPLARMRSPRLLSLSVGRQSREPTMNSRSRLANVALCICLCIATVSEAQDAFLQRGNGFLARRDFSSAEQVFREALQNDPRNRVYRAQLGLSLLQQKRHEEAERVLQSLLTEYPDDAAGSWYLAQNTYMAGRYRGAARRLRSVSRVLGPRSGQYYSADWVLGARWRSVLSRKGADVA